MQDPWFKCGVRDIGILTFLPRPFLTTDTEEDTLVEYRNGTQF